MAQLVQTHCGVKALLYQGYKYFKVRDQKENRFRDVRDARVNAQLKSVRLATVPIYSHYEENTTTPRSFCQQSSSYDRQHEKMLLRNQRLFHRYNIMMKHYRYAT